MEKGHAGGDMQKASCPSEIQNENRQGNQKGGRKREEGGEGGGRDPKLAKKIMQLQHPRCVWVCVCVNLRTGDMYRKVWEHEMMLIHVWRFIFHLPSVE